MIDAAIFDLNRKFIRKLRNVQGLHDFVYLIIENNK